MFSLIKTLTFHHLSSGEVQGLERRHRSSRDPELMSGVNKTSDPPVNVLDCNSPQAPGLLLLCSLPRPLTSAGRTDQWVAEPLTVTADCEIQSSRWPWMISKCGSVDTERLFVPLYFWPRTQTHQYLSLCLSCVVSKVKPGLHHCLLTVSFQFRRLLTTDICKWGHGQQDRLFLYNDSSCSPLGQRRSSSRLAQAAGAFLS